MASLKALKVKIGLKGNGQHDYPDFNKIDPKLRDNVDWSYFVDKHSGWLYDNLAGHKDDDPSNDSPVGIWIGYLLIPKGFADEAVLLFPDQCEIVNEATVEAFYEDRSTITQPTVLEDADIIAKIKNKGDLKLSKDKDDDDALDVDHPAPGRRTNDLKTWPGFKTKKNISIDEDS